MLGYMPVSMYPASSAGGVTVKTGRDWLGDRWMHTGITPASSLLFNLGSKSSCY